MSYCTPKEILEKFETTESRQEAREVAAIQKDISTARAAIADALARYRKTKLRARSRKAATEDPFEELKDYESRQQIHDDYGWGFITEKRMDYLMELWDAREESKKNGGATEYKDRVTDMLQEALNGIGTEYNDYLHDYNTRQQKLREEAERIARENNERTFQREHGGG